MSNFSPLNNLYIDKLSASHNVQDFDCGKPALNNFLINYALQNQQSDSSKTYVACLDNTVIGYYTLTVASVVHQDAPPRITKGLPKYPIPVALLARLAVSKDFQGRRIGSGLLKDCLKRVNAAADILGIRAVLVHAQDDEALRWYEHFNFEPSPTDPLHLFLLLKDIRRMLGNNL
ncbi:MULTISPECIES: GNAT family N-acetyltransferase [Calothrix]|uniref:GNAT family N-acetyltransferase n=2 Tax=Calothrix TaxID=1186 RepID=A0ABR8A3F9_9CYAN|nr:MULTISPECIES: GNAT family N-acetyltransferase [Calothrix]MBD2194293.1 GNAT family N-acetyltransferase [Calothrix parietina FACHB-288]MBD2229585.1 GNAT family N-acetyltransferase [Calothrix anomala FACHB-343]BAY60957.1 GCN5-related N-acetyltransferase [Calothrix brevissima NIES-22]